VARAGAVGTSAVAGAVGVTGWWAARTAVARIERNANPFPREQLVCEPEGEEVLIRRPEGTALRGVIAGKGQPIVLTHGPRLHAQPTRFAQAMYQTLSL
jgi:non-heme chloroperoxidase